MHRYTIRGQKEKENKKEKERQQQVLYPRIEENPDSESSLQNHHVIVTENMFD